MNLASFAPFFGESIFLNEEQLKKVAEVRKQINLRNFEIMFAVDRYFVCLFYFLFIVIDIIIIIILSFLIHFIIVITKIYYKERYNFSKIKISNCDKKKSLLIKLKILQYNYKSLCFSTYR